MHSTGSKVEIPCEFDLTGISEPVKKIIYEAVSDICCSAADGPKHDYWTVQPIYEHHRDQG